MILKGGLLDRPAENITLLEINEAVEGPVQRTACLCEAPACGGRSCVLGTAIQSIHRQVCEYLGETTLAELAQSLDLPVVPKLPRAETSNQGVVHG